MRAYFESLDQASQVIYTKWIDVLNKAVKWDKRTRTVRKQRREHITIMAASQAAAAKAKRELDRTMPVPPTPPPVAPVALLRSEAKLAPIQIPDFYGDKEEFTSYWDQFEMLVDKCPSIGKVQKFVNFRRSLHGPALRKIQHLRTTEANYEIAKDTIKRWYGNEDSVIRTIRSKLMSMRDWRGRADVKEKFDIAESYIQQLSTLTGEEYNAEEALDVLMKCLPYNYLERIQVFKNRALSWDLKEFRGAMMRIVMDDDEMADVLRGRNPERDQGHKPKQARFKDDRQQNTMGFAAVQSKKRPDNRSQNNNGNSSTQNRSGQKEANKSGQRDGRARPSKLCIFCAKAGHAHWKCPMSSRERTQVILRSNRCTRCLEEGHFNSNCKAEGCRKCGNMHHTFLHYDSPRQGDSPRYQIQQRAGNSPQYNVQNAQLPMAAAAYSPGYMVTGNPGSPSMYPMYQPIPMGPPNMNYSSYRQTVNGQQNRNTPRPSGQQRNGNGRQNIDPTPLSECGPVQREGNPSQRQVNNQIVTFSDARPMVTTNSRGS